MVTRSQGWWSLPISGWDLNFVQGTERILTCHRSHAEMYSKLYHLRIVNVAFEIPPIEMLLQWHKYREDDPALSWFRGLMQSVAKGI